MQRWLVGGRLGERPRYKFDIESYDPGLWFAICELAGSIGDPVDTFSSDGYGPPETQGPGSNHHSSADSAASSSCTTSKYERCCAHVVTSAPQNGHRSIAIGTTLCPPAFGFENTTLSGPMLHGDGLLHLLASAVCSLAQ
jgi:hypothetical protein